MISLIVCSINPQNLVSLQNNVNIMIGVKHEWLIWDNRKSHLGLSEVYNRMAEKANYPFLCFLHEDVLIETKDWGQLLIDICEKKNVALIGVAGGKYKSDLFSGWYSGGRCMDYYSVTHRVNNRDEVMQAPEDWPNKEVEVATIDGVFMFAKASSWAYSKFDETLLKGFHYYDIDFSIRVAKHEKVVVTNQLRLIHFSTGGDFGNKWVKETISWHNKMKDVLPFSVAESTDTAINYLVANYWLDWLKNMNINFHYKMKWIGLQQLYRHPALWYSILKFLFYKPLRLKKIHHFIINRRTR